MRLFLATRGDDYDEIYPGEKASASMSRPKHEAEVRNKYDEAIQCPANSFARAQEVRKKLSLNWIDFFAPLFLSRKKVETSS